MKTIEGFALSPQQERIWRLQAKVGFLRSAVIAKITGPLDESRVVSCLRALVKRHEILRTRFVIPELRKLPLQTIDQNPEFVWIAEDSSSTGCHPKSLLAEAAVEPIDLENGPALHARLVRINERLHYLVCSMPGLCSDVWSAYELVRQLAERYAGHQEPDSEDPVQYMHYAHWLEELREESESGRIFWEERHPRGGAVGHPNDTLRQEGYRWRFRIDAKLGSLLGRASETLNVSPQTLVLACWHIYLEKLEPNAASTLAVGFHGRNFQNLETALGPFSRFLPLKLELEDAWSLSRALTEWTKILREADELQHFYGLDPLPEAAVSHTFEWEADPTPTDPDPLRWEVLDHRHPREPFRLGLSLVLRKGVPFRLVLAFRSGTEKPESQLANQLLTLIEAALESPDLAIRNLPLLGIVQRHHLLVELNAGTQPDNRSHPDFYSLFLQRSRTEADRIALVAEKNGKRECRLSFRHLKDQAAKTAILLRSRGVTRDQVVAVCLPRSSGLVTAVLGVLAVGGVYLVLDSHLPEDRLKSLLKESTAKLIVSEGAPAWVPEGIDILNPVAADAAEATTQPYSMKRPLSTHLAYLVFTSGSTGKPKAVMVTRGNLNSYLSRIGYRLNLDKYETFAQVSTLAADLGNTVFFPPFCQGGTLFFLSESILADAGAFGAYFETRQIACLKITPSHLGALMHHPRPEAVLPRKCLILGGEASRWELLERIRRLAPDLAIHNHYGPSETTVGVLTFPYGKRRVSATPPLGMPLSGCRIYLTEKDLMPVGQGRPGELMIAGEQLSRGYLFEPAATAAHFLPNPFPDSPGARLYRTGDLAAYREGNRIEFLGRTDDQIKIRGYRVEPGEIETLLRAHPAVAHASVLVEKNPGEEPVLVAFLTTEPEANEGSEAVSRIRRFLISRLPTYMVPAHFQMLHSLPLTANGKVDRHALAALAAELHAAHEAPLPDRLRAANETEAHLLELWRNILKVKELGTGENFFDRGGHSLSGTVLISRVNQDYGLNLPLSALFESPTVRGMAQRVHLARLRMEEPSGLAALMEAAGISIEDARAWESLPSARLAELFQSLDPAAGARDTIPKLPREETESMFPLSFAQQRIWFMSQMQGIDTTYSRASAYGLAGLLHVPGLSTTLEGIVARHESLRTTFVTRDGKPRQRVHSQASFWKDAWLPIIDLNALVPAKSSAQARKLIGLEGSRPFDLTEGPLCRFALIRLDSQNHYLIFNIHHIISDGWSIGNLISELGERYTAFLQGRAPVLAELPIQYADFAAWQRTRLSDEAFENQLGYWRKRLSGAPPLLSLPTDRPRPAVQSFRGKVFRTRLDSRVTARLRKWARQNDATLFMALHTCFSALLAIYSDQRDIVIGTPVANRNRPELEPLIGFFVNTLVLRLAVNPEDSFQSLLIRARNEALGAFHHQDVPFEQIVEALIPERSSGFHPLFQVSLALQNAAPTSEIRLPGMRLETTGAEHVHAHIDLILFAAEQDEALLCGFQYNTDLFDTATMERMATHFTILVDKASAAPHRSLTSLSLLTGREREVVVEAWNRTGVSIPQRLVHRMVEAHARRAPDAMALVLDPPGTRHLTYGTLGARARNLAGRLAGRGWRGRVIGVHIARSPEMIIAVLGILKAGAAYLPLDPELPSERRRFMLDDSEAAGLLVAGPTPNLGKWPVLRIDKHDAWNSLALNPDALPVTASMMAYVIYTSGSTGLPKGVMVPHRGFANSIQSDIRAFRVEPRSRALHFVSLSFDAASSHIFMALGAGAALCQVGGRSAELSAHIRTVLRNQVVSHAAFPAPVLEAIGHEPLPALRLVISGAEACSPEMVARWAPGRRFFNVYGPTETAITATISRCSAEGHAKPLIGRPIINLQAFVVNPPMQPLPVGIAGELLLGGVGLAWGYLKRPSLTAVKFVPDPFVAEHGQTGPGGRLYRSGDRARFCADGNLEFLGRLDRQVKVRGFRIELGEIEALLGKNPAIREKAVVLKRDRGSSPKIIAYAIPDLDLVAIPQAEAQMVSQWEQIYTDEYQFQEVGSPVTPNFEGWNDSYSGRVIPEPEMLAWLDGVVSRICATRPKRVLEIGCGLGNILFKIAPQVNRYVATDLSEGSIRYVAQRLKAYGSRLPVQLRQAPANDFTGLGGESFDTVICNSVVQYFPGIEYLQRVLEGAVKLTAPGGSIFVGDVRCLPLESFFHYSVLLRQAPDWTRVSQLKQQAEVRSLKELELLVDPAFFKDLPQSLPRIGRVRIQLKRENTANELSRFRYDVHLQLKPVENLPEPEVDMDWNGPETEPESIRRLLETKRPVGLALRGIPNPRVREEARFLKTLFLPEEDLRLGEARKRAAALPLDPGVEPELFWKLGEDLAYDAEVTWSQDPTRYDVVFRSQTGFGNLAGDRVPSKSRGLGTRSERVLANRPLRGKGLRDLVSKLHRDLRAELPSHMLPHQIVLRTQMPLTSSGKIDRKALPMPLDLAGTAESAFQPPVTEDEKKLAGIWSELLGRTQIGIHDNFFNLGGHSLIATRVNSRIKDVFGVSLPLQSLFSSPTIGELCRKIAEVRQQTAHGEARIVPAPRTRPLPLSFAQQRLWFLDQLEGPNATYNIPSALRFQGLLDVPALEAAVGAIIGRHEVLRTTFPTRDGEAHQEIHAVDSLNLQRLLRVLDLRGIGQAHRTEYLRQVIRNESGMPFNLAEGPLLRLLIMLAQDRTQVLVVTMHHMISDGWSMGVLIQELSALYRNSRDHEGAMLPELSVQYADYAVWQRANNIDLEAQLDFWKIRLRDLPELLQLPLDRPRPTTQTFHGANVPFRLEAPFLEKLNELCRRTQTTLFMCLEAIVAVLFARYSGQWEVAVGTPVAGRSRKELEPLIGLFINTLVLRNDLRGNPTFIGLLDRTRQVAIQAFSHQDIPFERLVEVLQPPRSLNHSPLFQVMFSLQNMPMERLDLEGVAMAPLSTENAYARFDLTFSVLETPEGLTGFMNYNTDLFDRDTVFRMLAHYRNLAIGICDNAGIPVARLPLLSAEERNGLIYERDGAGASPRPRKPVNALIEATAARFPESVAIHVPGKTGGVSRAGLDSFLTYRALRLRARNLALDLRAFGLRTDEFVALYTDRSAELAVALWAILEAGGAYLPLDPSYPRERVRLMLEDAGIGLLVTQRHLSGDFAGRSLKIVHLEGSASIQGNRASPSLKSGKRLQRTAYIIYTSGSTGRPKGVVIGHDALSLFLENMQDLLALRRSDVWVAVTTIAFDIAALEIFLPLVVGCRLVLADRETGGDPVALAGLAEMAGGTVIQATPTTWSLFRSRDWKGLPGLTILSGGEALASDLADWLLSRGASLWNLYGPTEATIWAGALRMATRSALQAPPPGRSANPPVPIGPALGGYRLYLLDAFLEPQPPGAPGQLFIGGRGLARGYHGQPRLTAERFTPDPFHTTRDQESVSSGPVGARLYHTGDLAIFRNDGLIDFLGRMDTQIKLRGHRLELGEIETLLRRHPNVGEALVAVRGDGENGSNEDQFLVAYIVPAAVFEDASDEKRLRAELLDHMAKYLPAYAAHPLVMFLQSVPRLPNGKIDRRGLPSPERRPGIGSLELAPENGVELRLLPIWKEVIRLDSMGIDDNFFRLGGHSVLAVRLMARIQKELGFALPLSALFRAPTVRQLARHILDQGDRPQSPLVPIQSRGDRPPLFAVHGAGGGVLFYGPFGKHLNPGQPLFALEAQGMDGEREPLDRVEDMAEKYLAAVFGRQSRGPFLLGGFSVGGCVAYEMAQRLVRAGERVALLALFDTVAHENPEFDEAREAEEEPQQLIGLLTRLGQYLGQEVPPPPELPVETERKEQLEIVLDWAGTAGVLPPEFEKKRLYRQWAVFRDNIRAYRRYRFQPYPGRLTLFRSMETDPRMNLSPYRGWERYLDESRIEIQEVPGNHDTSILEPNLSHLCKKLNRCIERALVPGKDGRE